VVPGTLLLVSPALDLGGMELQLLELARAATRRGRRAVILAGPGPLEAQARSVAAVEIADWSRPRLETARRARELAGEGGTAVFQADPALLHLIAPLAAAGAVHLCLHNRPGTFEQWFNPATLERFRRLVPALHASGRVAFSASSMRGVRGHAAGFGLPEEAILPWFPGLDVPTGHDDRSSGPIATVAVVCRLSPEKLPLIAAGAELVAAGRAAGADVRLAVHGGGPSEADARALLAGRLPAGEYRLHGPTDHPLEAIATADVVVNSGRAAIEGLMTGRRVVCSRIAAGAEGLGPPVLEADFAALKDDNFAWDRPPLDPRVIWAQLNAMPAETVRGVRDRARRELSADALLETHLAAMARTDAARPPAPALLEGVIELALALDDAHAEVKEIGDRLWLETRALLARREEAR
jgi:hypothetical protein